MSIVHEVIDDMLIYLETLAEVSSDRRLRWELHNPSRLVTPIEFDRHTGKVMALTACSGNQTTWTCIASHPNTRALAVPLCELHNIRNVWMGNW